MKRQPRKSMAHGTRCIHLGSLKTRKLLALYSSPCKNPVVSVFECSQFKECVPHKMQKYQGYIFCLYCPKYKADVNHEPEQTIYCDYQKKSRNECVCTRCGKVIKHNNCELTTICKSIN